MPTDTCACTANGAASMGHRQGGPHHFACQASSACGRSGESAQRGTWLHISWRCRSGMRSVNHYNDVVARALYRCAGSPGWRQMVPAYARASASDPHGGASEHQIAACQPLLFGRGLAGNSSNLKVAFYAPRLRPLCRSFLWFFWFAARSFLPLGHGHLLPLQPTRHDAMVPMNKQHDLSLAGPGADYPLLMVFPC